MTIFQPFRPEVSESPVLTVISGTTTQAYTGYIKIFFQNLAGTNLGSTGVLFNTAINQGLRITVPSIMVKSGELPERYIVGYSASGNEGTFIQIGSIKALNTNGLLNALPLSIDITTDNGFNPNLNAANFASLPNNVQNGKLAISLDTGVYYQYLDSVWIPFWKGNTFLIEPINLDSIGGFLQDSISVDNFTENLIYEADGNFSRNYYTCYLNDGSNLIPSSTLLGLTVLINGVPNTSLAERLEIRLLGYVSLDTGILDTSPSVGYPTLIWSGSRDSGFILPTDLPSQSVAVFIVRFNYNASELSTVQPNSTIALDLFLYTDGSIPAEYATITGNFIVDIADDLVVTPSIGLAVDIKSGQAVIGKRQSTIKPSQTIPLLLANTTNQLLIIDSEINGRIEQFGYTLRNNEDILAVIDTLPFELISDPVVRNITTGGISITLENYIINNKVRSDYPDSYINNQIGDFNVDFINVYLNNGTTVYKLQLLGADLDSQVINITALPSISVLPTVTLDNSYGLYKWDNFVISNITGTIPNGNYDVYVSYQWLNTSVTKIQMVNSPLTIKKLNPFSDLLSSTPSYNTLSLEDIATDPSTSSSEIVLYNKGNELFYRKQSNGDIIQFNTELGITVYFDNAIPDNTLGSNNDVYFRITNGVAYKKEAGTWVSKINFVIDSELVAAINDHLAASDPHPQYLTQTEGDSRYPLNSTLSETIDDRVNALLQAGTDVTLTYNDVSNTLTIDFTASSGGGASGVPYTYNDADPPTSSGQIRTAQASLAVATSVAINGTDANSDSASDVLGRLKAGAIFTISKDSANYVRFEATADYASGVVAVTVRSEQGAIANGDAVFLDIVSDSPGAQGNPGTVTAASSLSLLPQSTDPSADSTYILVYAKTDNKIYRRLRSGDGGGIQELGAGSGGGRVRLTADRTYYVRTDGTRTGLLSSETDATTNTSGDAFGSLVDAINALSKIDCNGFIPEISLGTGTFSAPIECKNFVGADKVIIRGNGSNNTNIGKVSTAVIQYYEFFSLKVLYSSAIPFDTAITCLKGKLLIGGNCIIEYNNSSSALSKGGFIFMNQGGVVEVGSGVTFTGSSSWGILAQNLSVFDAQAKIINFVGATIDQYQFFAVQLSMIELGGATVNGTPGGTQYEKRGGAEIRMPNFGYF